MATKAKKTKSIKIQRVFPYTVDKLWKAISDAEQVSKWLMQTDIKPKVGHKFQFRAEPMQGWRGWVDCEITEVQPRKKLSYTWQGMPEHSITTVTYELEEVEGGTLVKARHEGFDSTHGFLSGIIVRGILGGGWRKMFKKLIPPVLAEMSREKVAA